MKVGHCERMRVIVHERDGLAEQIGRLAVSVIVDESEERTEREAVRELREIEDALAEGGQDIEQGGRLTGGGQEGIFGSNGSISETNWMFDQTLDKQEQDDVRQTGRAESGF